MAIKLNLKRILFLIRLILKGDFRGVFRYNLWLIGYQNTLPTSVICNIPIIENGEDLVGIPNHSKIICIAPHPFVRESVAKMLVVVADNLPQGFCLKIFYAFRDQETQQRFWNEALNDAKNKNPNANSDEIIRIAKSLSAEPGGIGPHQTGGAVDVTLADLNGNELQMGTNYRDHSNIAKIPMFSKFCIPTEKANRAILRKAMLGAGFYFYPGEWWHYSYGDQSWAAYVGNSHAIYGESRI
jgi:D-alanyl-D-alanine dipeptidase